MKKNYGWMIVFGVLALALLAFNFLDFHVTSSRTESGFNMGTVRSGDTLPANMSAPFVLAYQVHSAERLAEPLQAVLQEELAALPVVLQAERLTDTDANDQGVPLLVVKVDTERYFWTPFYARGAATAVVTFSSDGDDFWQSGDPLVLETSPAIKSRGEFTLSDASWGLISKPAYAQHLSRTLAKSIAEGLQGDVLTLPSGG